MRMSKRSDVVLGNRRPSRVITVVNADEPRDCLSGTNVSTSGL